MSLLAVSGIAFGSGLFLQNSTTRRASLRASSQIAQAETGRYALRSRTPSRPSPPTEDADDEARRTFDTVYSLVKQHFVDKLPSDSKMGRSAVRAMLASLNDPNTYFLEPEQFALVNAEGQGHFSGIGASTFIRQEKRDGYTENKIVVVAPLPDSPAEKAGLHPGDIITHIDGKWVLGFDPFLKANQMVEQVRKRDQRTTAEALQQEVVSARKRAAGGIGLFPAQMALRGDLKILHDWKLPAEKRVLTVMRPGVKSPLVLTLDTATTDIAPLTAKTLAEGIGYIHVPLFTDKTVEQMKEALSDLPKEKGLILDLRGNAGGLLDAAMTVEAMLAPGTPFGFEVTAGNKKTTLRPNDTREIAHPLVVLVDKGTASVAEALALSLADSGTATLVGRQTFGDAAVQMAYALPDGSAFVLTTGKMLGPHQDDWATKGIAPKIAVAANVPEEQVLSAAVNALRARPQVATGTH